MATIMTSGTSLFKHELKLLNIGLIFYILLGALLFHSLGEFEVSGPVASHAPGMSIRTSASDKRPTGASLSRSGLSRHLSELRLGSVKRMWNITNQLNILYETNWTQLVLAELVEFEQRLVESISVTQQQQQQRATDYGDEQVVDDEGEPEVEVAAEVEEGDEKREKERDNGEEKRDKKGKEEREEEKKRREKKNRSRLARIRLKSIKMSLVHSIATVTTMSSPIKPPSSQWGKLATILYGSLGIPLLLFTVTKSGLQVAQRSLNGLLVVRHYCFSLPLYYLGSLCNICLWLRLLSWCCCCCCCSYLLCHLYERRQAKRKANRGPPADRLAAGCCGGHREAPKLKLRPREGAPEPREAQQAQQPVAYVIGFNHQTSVPFEQESQATDEAAKLAAQQKLATSRSADEFYSPGLALTSVAVLVVYVSLGAYYYSRTQNISLLDATFACYSMLSTSKLPDSFQLSSMDNLSVFDFYKSLSGQQKPPVKVASKVDKIKPNHSFESMIRDSIYLLVGLHLISACAQFVRLWLNGEAQRRLEPLNCPYHQPSTNCSGGAQVMFPPAPSAPNNNNSHSLAGSFNQQQPGESVAGSFGQTSRQQHDDNQLARLIPHQQPHQRQALSLDNSLQSADRGELLASNKSPEQIDLAELFVVDGQHQQPAHQFELEPANYGTSSSLHRQQQLINNSGGSFASDRSSDARSLCLHHQAQVQQQQQAAILTGGSFYGATAASMAPAAVYGTTRANTNIHTNSNGQHGSHLQLASRADDDDDDDDDEGDLNRMLTTCDVQSGPATSKARLRPSSSSLQLSDDVGQQMAPKGQHFDHLNHRHQSHHYNLNSNTIAGSRGRLATRSIVGQPQATGGLDYTNGFATTNGFGGNSEQVDSSPNTIDTNSTTNNSQTVSSMSSRRATVSFNNTQQDQPHHLANGTEPENKQQVGFIFRHHTNQ